MPKYLIERELPGAGKLSPAELKAISQKSCGVLNALGPQIQWVQSYVTDDKIYCIYIAPNAEMVKQHAEQGGFPADPISEIKAGIGAAAQSHIGDLLEMHEKNMLSTKDIQRRKALADEAFARRFEEVMKKHNSANYVAS